MSYAEILFQQKIAADKDTLTYEIPENLKVKVGQLVKVSLRKSSKTGLIWKLHDKKPSFRTLAVSEIAQEQPLLSEIQITLAKWISEYYFCPVYKTLKLFIPKRIFNLKKIPKTKAVINEQKFKTKKSTNFHKDLTDAQKNAIDLITTSSANKFLIQGVTGSGKTEIYVKLADFYIKKGQQVLILIPEISLTHQTVDYFEKALGLSATVINSKQSEGERQLAWQNIHNNKSKLIIGSRSAIFSPFQDLGIIIIDEEQESSYKQDNAPRYSIHRIIEKLLELNPKIKAIFGSATPQAETAELLKETTLKLGKRIGNSVMPDIEIVDLRDEFKKKNYSIFSDRLHEELAKILEEGNQAILFINRRGSASSVVCRDCGYAIKCTDCDLPMTYHAKTLGTPKLICHHCGEITNPPSTCPVCKGPNIRYLGIGTQKIEEELLKEFPKIKALRADKDTTTSKHGFKEIYKQFRDHKIDVLIGTQMIAKGLDIENVNLVGVVLADIGINIPDFRSTERNYELMTQVSGRAGRREKKGKVIIQTYNPDNIALRLSQDHDYDKFFQYEITQRKIMQNPPFSRLAKLTFQDKSFLKCKSETEKLEHLLRIAVNEEKLEKEIEILSYPAYITKLRGLFRYLLLIKDKSKNNLIHKLLGKLPKEYIMGVNPKIDIDPLNIT